MRKILILFALIVANFFVVSLHEAYTAPCYGTKTPEKREFFAGEQPYSIFKRYAEGEYGKLRSLQHFFLLSYGVTDWFSLDLKVGGGNIKQHPVGSDEIDYPTDFAGGYGFRVKFFENDDHQMKAVFGFQHISVHPGKVQLENVKNKAVLDDWQWSLLFSKGFGRVNPYLGLKWSRLDYIHWVVENRKRKMSDLTKSVGAIFGCDISITDTIWLNVEGHAVDEEAASLAIMFRF